jgi:hypothetical protein
VLQQHMKLLCECGLLFVCSFVRLCVCAFVRLFIGSLVERDGGGWSRGCGGERTSEKKGMGWREGGTKFG